MRPPPSLTHAPAYPVTAGLALLAIVVTFLVMQKPPAGAHPPDLYGLFAMDLRAFELPPRGQPWRLLSSTLPHVGWIHLIFNVVWLWAFGTTLEARYGLLRYLGLIVVVAVASSAAEYAFFAGGVGLSGVGYGLFGFRWAMARRDPRSIDLMDERTTATFVLWFFVCIATTYTGLMAVANVAHGVGALTGMAIGFAVASAPRWTIRARAVAGALALAVVLLSVLCATVWRPMVNHHDYAGSDAAEVARALLKRRPPRLDEARRYLHRCLAYTPRQRYCAALLDYLDAMKLDAVDDPSALPAEEW